MVPVVDDAGAHPEKGGDLAVAEGGLLEQGGVGGANSMNAVGYMKALDLHEPVLVSSSVGRR
jgi:hypothetical protein